MPIRINLLAEQQMAEEARRRDPVKRTLWAGGGVLVLLLLWGISIQVDLMQKRSHLRGEEARWKQMEPTFLQASNQVREAGVIQKNLDDLQRYVTNRFLWTEPLNALQHATDDQVRLISFSGVSKLKQDPQVLVSSNLFLMRPARSWWSFWAAEPPKTNMNELAWRVLGTMTNRADLLRYQSELLAHINVITNPVQIVAQLEVVKPETVTETVTLRLRGRDYSQPPGARMDRFFAAITNTPFFKAALGKTNSSIQPESIQPRDDRTDLIRPADLFIPFTIECVFPEKIRSNE